MMFGPMRVRLGQGRAVPALAVATILLLTTGEALADSKTALGFGPGFFIEDSAQDFDQERGGNLVVVEDQEWESDGLFSISGWFLTPVLHKDLRVGGGIAWYNKYTMRPPGEEDPDDGSLCEETDDCQELGQLFQLYWEADFTIPKVASDLGILFGARVGMLTLLPAGELKAEITRLDNQGYDVYPDLPRLGLFAGPHVGVIWPLNERLDVRADIGAQFSRLWLYDGTAEAAGVPNLREASGLSTTRYSLLVGLEIGF
jgi:hypothetical protein